MLAMLKVLIDINLMGWGSAFRNIEDLSHYWVNDSVIFAIIRCCSVLGLFSPIGLKGR